MFDGLSLGFSVGALALSILALRRSYSEADDRKDDEKEQNRQIRNLSQAVQSLQGLQSRIDALSIRMTTLQDACKREQQQLLRRLKQLQQYLLRYVTEEQDDQCQNANQLVSDLQKLEESYSKKKVEDDEEELCAECELPKEDCLCKLEELEAAENDPEEDDEDN